MSNFVLQKQDTYSGAKDTQGVKLPLTAELECLIGAEIEALLSGKVGMGE